MADFTKSKGYINVKIDEIRAAIRAISIERGQTMTEVCGYYGLNTGTLSSSKVVYLHYARAMGLPEDKTLGRIRPIDHARLSQILGGDIDKYVIKKDLPAAAPEPEPEPQPEQDPRIDQLLQIQMESYKLLKQIAYHTKIIAEAIQ